MEVDKEDTQQQQQQAEENDVIISISCLVDGSIEKCSLSKLQLIPFFATKTSDHWWTDDESVTLHESFANGNSVHALLYYVSHELLPASPLDEQHQHPPSRLLLTKLPRECDLSHVMQLADFFCLDLPGVAKTVEELVELEMRLKQIKEVVEKPKSKNRKKKNHVNNTNDTNDDDDEQCTKSRIMAQDAAALLALTIHARKLDTTKKQIKQKLFSDVFFVVSHARTFGPRIRTHVWKNFAALAELTDKQKTQVAKWTSEAALAYDFHEQQQHRRDDKKSNNNNGKKSKDNNNTHSPKDEAKADGGANKRKRKTDIEGSSSAASLVIETTKKCKIG